MGQCCFEGSIDADNEITTNGSTSRDALTKRPNKQKPQQNITMELYDDSAWLALIARHSSASASASTTTASATETETDNNTNTNANEEKSNADADAGSASSSSSSSSSANKFVNSSVILNRSYRNSAAFYNYYELEISSERIPHKSLKAELLNNSVYAFGDSEYEVMLKHAQFLLSSKKQIISEKFNAKRDGGIYEPAITAAAAAPTDATDAENENTNHSEAAADAVLISEERIISLLVYIHFPKYVQQFYASFGADGNGNDGDMAMHEQSFYNFGRNLFVCIEYFGENMPDKMVVYHALSTKKRYLFDFFNTSFITQPLSCTANLEMLCQSFKKNENANENAYDANSKDHVIILELQSQFVGDFNDTRYLDISDLSSMPGPNQQEIVFWGEWAELSVTNIITIDAETQQPSLAYTDWMKGLKYWQKLTAGFADFNVRKYNLGHELNEKTQSCMCQIVRKEKAVPEYIAQLFEYYTATKTGVSYHKMYTEQLDIDFGKIVKKAFKHMTQETRDLLFNEDVSNIDPQKMKQIFVNGVKYRDTLEQTVDF